MHRGEEKFNPQSFIEPEVSKQGYVDPDHYKNRKYEVFDVMRDTQTYERHIGYLEGCVIKYMMRWDKKNDDPLMDLRKAKRYLEQLIQTIESEEEQHAMVSNGEQIGTDNIMQRTQTRRHARTVGRTIKW
jgi:predicted ribonuclease YlaK